MIEFRTLGTLDLRDPSNGDLASVLARRKLVALLAHLLLARPRGFRERDTLVGIFWPESSQTKARRALNQALYELRRALGDEVLVSRGAEEVGLDDRRVWCDAAVFEDAVDRGDHAAALDLYRGDLLVGLALPGCGAFEAWLDERREDLRSRALRVAWRHARDLASAGNRVEAVYWLRRALRWEPYEEGILQELLGHLLALGDRTGAVREYTAFAERLLDDLEVEPASATTALVEGIVGVDSVRPVGGMAGPVTGEARSRTAARRPLPRTPLRSLS